MSGQSAIDLSRTEPFSIGPLGLRPAGRELVLGDQREVLEPRVMQVLLALAREAGEVVTRESLTESCWDGRVVGEDAIHRVMSRLRRVTAGIGKDIFRIDTVTKSGYRLVLLVQDGANSPQADILGGIHARYPPYLTRRTAMVAGLAAALVAGGGWLIEHRRDLHSTPPTDVEPLMTQAEIAQSQQTSEGQNQAIGLLRKVVALRPDYPDGWATLAHTYFVTSRFRDTPTGNAMRLRGEGAVSRALELDPGNVLATAARSLRHGTNGHWLEIQRALDSLGQDRRLPRTITGIRQLLFREVGRSSESLAASSEMIRQTALTPNLASGHLNALWCARRVEEAEQFANEAGELFPTHFGLWFQRCYFFLYSGKPDRSLAMIDAVADRPSAIPASEFDELRLVAQALQSRDPDQAKEALGIHLKRAHEGSGRAENTIQFASALDRRDEAFAIAEAYYFGRGFVVPELRFSHEQGTYLRADDRLTAFLFNPALDEFRGDRRFDRMAEELGLKMFWQASGLQPDYLRTA